MVSVGGPHDRCSGARGTAEGGGEGWGVSNEGVVTLFVRCTLLPGQASASPGLLCVPSTICPILSTWPSLSLTRSSVRSTHYLSYTVLCALRGMVECVPHNYSSGVTVSIGVVGLGVGVL
jgi:hypothetical protein